MIDSIGNAFRYEELSHTLSERWFQRALIIASIATVVILSAAQVISTGYLVASLGAVCLFPTKVLLGFLLAWVLNRKPPPSKSEYRDLIAKAGPFAVSVAVPFLEELIFRGILQNGCQTLLKHFITDVPISLLGVSFSAVGLQAILVTSAIFGAAHYFNMPQGADIQAVLTAVSGVFTGVIFYQYGFFAAFLSHCTNNCIAETVLALQKEPTDPVPVSP